ncbi:MAG TPA: hypothetical protein VHB25_01595 [Gemmatimonadaceae bacterium]|nr:hypothetical protein [Gemmatimonadaceae bacterium]
MYATCLFCNKDLRRNETFETFPVGKRLAFDAAHGRLWVVCPHCERWNLSPLDERWEAIEAAERLYRDTRKRVATDNIGLAKLRDGTTIVRIGEPLRPEFAAWRYGDQFGRRRRRQMLIVGGGLGALAALIAGGAAVGVGIGGFGWMIGQAGTGIIRGNPETVVAKIKGPNGQTMAVRRRHLLETSIEPGIDSPLAINLRFKNGSARFEGEQAMHIASRVIPAANRFGGSKQDVARAVEEIERAGSPEGFLTGLSPVAQKLTTAPRKSRRGSRAGMAAALGNPSAASMVTVARSGAWSGRGWGARRDWSTGLFALTPVQRLALEMSLHEEAERAAMQGELTQLERAWREAEEIAKIADDMLVPEPVTQALTKLRES